MQYLFHGSKIQNLSVLKPQRTLSKNKYIGDYVFATTFKEYAAMNTIAQGVGFLMNYESIPKRVLIASTLEHYESIDQPCAIYTISPESFEKTPQIELDSSEVVSKRPVKVVKSDYFDSSISALKAFNIDIYYITKEIFLTIVNKKTAEEKVIKSKEYLKKL